MAVADPHRMLGEVDAAPLGRGFAEEQRGAGRRVDLVAVVHLEDLDVEIVVERLRRLADEHGEEIDAEAHVARLDHRRVTGRGDDLRLVLRADAGGADDVDDAGLGGELGELDGRRGNGEIEDAIGLGEDRQGIVGDRRRRSARGRRGRRRHCRVPARPRVRSRRPAPRRGFRRSTRIRVRPIRPAAPTTTSFMSSMDEVSSCEQAPHIAGSAGMGKPRPPMAGQPVIAFDDDKVEGRGIAALGDGKFVFGGMIAGERRLIVLEFDDHVTLARGPRMGLELAAADKETCRRIS